MGITAAGTSAGGAWGPFSDAVDVHALALVDAGSPVGLVVASVLVLVAGDRWRQVFNDRPTTGFTLAIVFIAAGFIVGPSSFGVLATRVGRPVALLTAAAPALLVALVPPSRDDRLGAHDPDRHGDAASV